MKKKCKVVMLPTNKKQLHKGQVVVLHGNLMPSIHDVLETDWEKYDYRYLVKPQYLYISSDDEIREGDWVYSEIANTVFQIDGYTDCPNYWKKIIATTDESLKICKVNDGVCFEANHCLDCKANISLPRPSNEFIKEFCEKGGIFEVMVEYESACKTCDSIRCHTHEGYCGFYDTLKVAPDNTISIYPEKDSWNREEIENLIRLAYQKGLSDFTEKGGGHSKKSIDKWIEENL